MSDLLEKCSVCSALLDEEDFFCANCGTEAPPRAAAIDHDATQTVTHHFECEGCGASMSYDAEAQSLRCPFCGSEQLRNQADATSIEARLAVPFVVNHTAASAALRRWLGAGFWRPNDLSHRAAITNMTAVYVPYWVFRTRTFTYWTADTNQTPRGARGDWYPLAGEHHGQYEGQLVGASGVLTPEETKLLRPFDLAAAVAPDQVDMQEKVVEQFRVQRKYARPLARQGVEELERQACQQYVPGRSRNLKVNVRLEGLSSDPVLLPVWIMAYRYRDQVFRFLLNGQSGKATGTAPRSWKKMLAAIVLVAIVILAIVIAGGIIGNNM